MDILKARPAILERAGGWVAVDACTLPTAERPLRLAEFDQLFATSLRETRRLVGRTEHARLLLGGDHTLAERVQTLADAEASCCSFFTFAVTSLDTATAEDATVALDISVPPERADILEALVTRADATRQGAS